MAQNTTNTYQIAKVVFDTLGLKEDMILDIDVEKLPIFRKHLSEMIKRQQSSFKYATRIIGNKVKVFRIQ
jgi:hypothetical protein